MVSKKLGVIIITTFFVVVFIVTFFGLYGFTAIYTIIFYDAIGFEKATFDLGFIFWWCQLFPYLMFSYMKQEFLHLSFFIQKDIYFTVLFFTILLFMVSSNVANAQTPIDSENFNIVFNIDEKDTSNKPTTSPLCLVLIHKFDNFGGFCDDYIDEKLISIEHPKAWVNSPPKIVLDAPIQTREFPKIIIEREQIKFPQAIIAPPPLAKTTQQIIIEQTTLLEDIRTLLIFLSLIGFFILLIIFTINLKIRKEK